MKYNIHINQKILSKYDINLVDSAILDYIIFLCASKHPRVASERVDGYTWVDYGTLLEAMPLLRIKTEQSLTPRFKKLVQAGFIKTKGKRVNGHKRLLVQTVRLVDSLLVEILEPTRESIVNNTNKDNTNIHTGKDVKKSSISQVSTVVDSLYAKKKNKAVTTMMSKFIEISPSITYGHKTHRKCCSDLIDTLGEEKAIEITEKAIELSNEQYSPTITTPYELWTRLAKVQIYIEQNDNVGRRVL